MLDAALDAALPAPRHLQVPAAPSSGPAPDAGGRPAGLGATTATRPSTGTAPSGARRGPHDPWVTWTSSRPDRLLERLIAGSDVANELPVMGSSRSPRRSTAETPRPHIGYTFCSRPAGIGGIDALSPCAREGRSFHVGRSRPPPRPAPQKRGSTGPVSIRSITGCARPAPARILQRDQLPRSRQKPPPADAGIKTRRTKRPHETRAPADPTGGDRATHNSHQPGDRARTLVRGIHQPQRRPPADPRGRPRRTRGSTRENQDHADKAGGFPALGATSACT